MSQAIHIFRKDARRFWPQILAVISLFGIYAVLSPEPELSGSTSLLEWGGLLSLLIVLACWTLTAGVVHEDAPAQGSPFWLTRPYGRGSLLSAKVLFLFVFVFLPLLMAGVVLELRSGVNVAANSGTLVAVSMVRSSWLILPALAIGAVTRNLTEFASGICTLILLLALAELRVTGHWFDLLSTTHLLATGQNWYAANAAAVLPMVLAAIGTLILQYAARRTQWSRRLLLAAVIVSGLLMPNESVARFSTEAMNPGFDANRIRLAYDESVPPQPAEIRKGGFCWSVLLRQEGVPGIALQSLHAEAPAFTGGLGGKIYQPVTMEEAEGGYRETVCGWGPRTETATLQTSTWFAVLSVSQIATIPVKRGVLDAGDAGRCEIIARFPTSELRCNLAEPVEGSVSVGLEYPGYKAFSRGFGEGGSIRLNPVSQQKFTGTTILSPGGWPIDEALRRGDAKFVLRREHIIGYLHRDLVYPNMISPWRRWAPRVPLKPR